MTPEKYKVHSELVYDLVTEKLLEAIAPYSVDVQFLMVADILTQITQDFLTNALDSKDENGIHFANLMEARLSKISQKFFREKNMHI
jgi:hypothetical protein